MYKYIPESWRKKLKPGQKLWYLRRKMFPYAFDVVSGTFERYEPYIREWPDKVWVRQNSRVESEQIPEDWVFNSEENAKKALRCILESALREEEYKLSRLKAELKKARM